ncbi:hypothetical protein [Acinetobacter sp. WCHAc060025]|uniref:hypothetical protein n=1 Tax=Acinetobacter sp. WCHAc060025 TaxID=2518625 RepID=UPI001022A9D8|nr:hypothetical protein [Acinetobacter sp. WCHAc060025]RZG75403.1 hypothetical protein EXE09_10940 [Acinetobacter sp. WCHAc060025]
MNIVQKECEEIYSILEETAQDESKNKVEKSHNIDLSFLTIGIISIIYSFITKLIFLKNPNNIFLESSFIFLAIIGYISIVISPLCGLIIDLFKNYKSIKNPLSILFKRINHSTIVDIKAAKKLSLYNKDELDFALMELKHELEDFNKRITSITGQLSRIGLFPAIVLGLTAISTQLGKDKILLNNLGILNQFIIFLTIGIILLYFFSLFANLKSSDLERNVKILEYVIQYKKDNKTIIYVLDYKK